MIAHFLEKSRDLLQPIHAVLVRDKQDSATKPARHFTDLNQQYLNILLYPVIKQASGLNTFSGFSLLSSPEYRSHFLADLPIQAQRYQYACKHFPKDHQRILNYCQKHHQLSNSIDLLLNVKPFCHNRHSIKNTQDAINQLDSNYVHILIAAALTHNFIDKHDELSQAYFFQSLEQAYMCYQIAHFYRNSPTNSFINTLIHGLSLIAIHKELKQHNLEETEQQSIINEVCNFLPKLGYWLAKDIGLNDELLFDIKYKYLDANQLRSDKALLVGELSHQCIQLYQYKLLSKKEMALLLHEIDHTDSILSTLTNTRS